MKKASQIFRDLPPTLILDTHYLPEEVVHLRETLESHGCPVTSSIFHAELVITKLTQEKRARRELSDLVRKQKGDIDVTTKEMVVIKDKWVRKCLEEDKLVDWPFTNTNFFWQIARVESIQPITPPKRQLSQDKFAVPGEPASKRRTLSRSGSLLLLLREGLLLSLRPPSSQLRRTTQPHYIFMLHHKLLSM